MNNITCCFLGHRKITATDELKDKLYKTIKRLIIEENVDTFLFGSKSQFNDLCYEIVSELKSYFLHLNRIYVRAEFPYIDNDYKSYILQNYEKTYYPDNIINAGRLSYVERNIEMINKSKFCIMYYNVNYTPSRHKSKNINLPSQQTKSGTKIAYEYALKKKKTIINIYDVQ